MNFKSFALRVCIALALSSALFSSCAKQQAKKDYPMFWSWLTYRPTMDVDSLCNILNETGIEGIMLNAPKIEDYRNFISVAKKYDITVYAWLWTLNPGYDREYVLKEHPEWLSVNRLGESLADYKAYVNSYKFLCPAVEEAMDFIDAKVKALCELDGLDGVSIDYCRFVDVVLPTSLWYNYGVIQDHEYPQWDFGYHPLMIEGFKAKYGYDPRDNEDPSKDEKWAQYRCDMITAAANRFIDTIHSYGKVAAASPFPTPKMSSAMVRQDWGKWNLDLVFPMNYSDFYTMDPSFAYDCTVENVRDKNPNTTLYSGLGLNLGGPVENIFDNMDAAFAAGAQGVSVYTVEELKSPQIRARFKAYTDSLRTLKAASGGVLPFTLVAAANPDPLSHKTLLAYIEHCMQRLIAGEKIHGKSVNGMLPEPEGAQYAPLKLGQYQLVKDEGVTRVYNVSDSASGKTFAVSFFMYGGIVSGWDLELAR